MGILKKKDPWELEFREVWKKEQKFLRQYAEKRNSVIDQKVSEVVSEKLLETLHTAFEKAFIAVFEKGSGIIQKAGHQENRRKTCKVNTYAADMQENRKHLQAFAREANRAARRNLLISGTAGLGMGLLGAALPDVPLLTAMLLKCIYETAESFGFPCEGEAEQLYVLKILETALSDGDELRERNQTLERFAQTGIWPEDTTFDFQIKRTARQLSQTLLYGKALQTIPVVGVLGGAEDAVCMDRIRRFAAIKYQKRFLMRRRLTKR